MDPDGSPMSNQAGASGARDNNNGGNVPQTDFHVPEDRITSNEQFSSGATSKRSLLDPQSVSETQPGDGWNSSLSDYEAGPGQQKSFADQSVSSPNGRTSKHVKLSDPRLDHPPASPSQRDLHHVVSQTQPQNGRMYRSWEDEEEDDRFGTDDEGTGHEDRYGSEDDKLRSGEDGDWGNPKARKLRLSQAQCRALLKLAEFLPDLSQEERKVIDGIGQRNPRDQGRRSLAFVGKKAGLLSCDPQSVSAFSTPTERLLQSQSRLDTGRRTYAGGFSNEPAEPTYSRVKLEASEVRCRGGLPRGTARRMGSVFKGMSKSVSLPFIDPHGAGGGVALHGPAGVSGQTVQHFSGQRMSQTRY